MKIKGYIFYRDREDPVPIPDNLPEARYQELYQVLQKLPDSVTGYLIIKEDD